MVSPSLTLLNSPEGDVKFIFFSFWLAPFGCLWGLRVLCFDGACNTCFKSDAHFGYSLLNYIQINNQFLCFSPLSDNILEDNIS